MLDHPIISVTWNLPDDLPPELEGKPARKSDSPALRTSSAMDEAPAVPITAAARLMCMHAPRRPPFAALHPPIACMHPPTASHYMPLLFYIATLRASQRRHALAILAILQCAARSWSGADPCFRHAGGEIIDVGTLRLSSGEPVSTLVWSPSLTSPAGDILKTSIRVVNRTDVYRCHAPVLG